MNRDPAGVACHPDRHPDHQRIPPDARVSEAFQKRCTELIPIRSRSISCWCFSRRRTSRSVSSRSVHRPHRAAVVGEGEAHRTLRSGSTVQGPPQKRVGRHGPAPHCAIPVPELRRSSLYSFLALVTSRRASARFTSALALASSTSSLMRSLVSSAHSPTFLSVASAAFLGNRLCICQGGGGFWSLMGKYPPKA